MAGSSRIKQSRSLGLLKDKFLKVFVELDSQSNSPS